LEELTAAVPLDQQDERTRRALALGTIIDAVRFNAAWYDPWRDAPDTLVARLQPFTWVTFPVQIRHVFKTEHLVPWHQDVGYQRVLGSRGHGRHITCFVPLDDKPATTSTLEFAIGDFSEIAHAPQNMHGATIDHPETGTTRRFDLMQGDALVFGDHMPHRTVPGVDGLIDRWSFEYRLVQPDEASEGRDYFDIAHGLFVRTDGSTRTFPE
jgi:hypothetical protein